MSSEEADLLREMVADRDRRIVMVKQNTTDLDEKQQRLLDELDSATELTARQQITHQTEKTKLLHNLHLAADQLGHMEADLHQQGSSLASYANMVSQQHNDDGISPVTPSNVDQNTVMRMQAQLCKAMHSMGILDHQLQLTSDMCESCIKMQRDAMAAQRESKAQLELQLLNDMMRADTEKREAEDGLKKQIKDLQGQIKVLERELDEYEDDDDKEKETNEDEEDDEETMKAKGGIWKLLEQRREQVTDLEKHLDSQEVELSQLRETLGEDVVEAPEERPPPPKHAPPPLPENVDDSESEVNEEEEDDNKPDEAAARLAQVMENAKLEDVERAGSVHELDLLKMAQNRLAGASADEEEEEESSEEESDEEQEESDEEQGESAEEKDEEGGGESTPPTQEELQSEAFESVEADPTLSVADDEEPAEVVNALSAERPAEMHDQPTETIGALSSSACDEALQRDEVPEEEEEKKNPEEEELPTTGEKPAHNGVRHDENSEITEAAE